jgi:hypothetical protein
LPSVALKWVQLLEYDGKPLGVLAYLDGRTMPLALCIYANGGLDAGPVTEQRAGLNIVHWTTYGHAFMLVGHAAMPPMAEPRYGPV